MSNDVLFFDSSALIAGIVSSQGAARALLLLAENEKIDIIVSEQVIAEVERNIARKIPRALPFARELILHAKIRIIRDPRPEETLPCEAWIKHPPDISILAAASFARVDFLVTLNTKHFIDDPKVAHLSGLRIGTPGDALIWISNILSSS